MYSLYINGERHATFKELEIEYRAQAVHYGKLLKGMKPSDCFQIVESSINLIDGTFNEVEFSPIFAQFQNLGEPEWKSNFKMFDFVIDDGNGNKTTYIKSFVHSIAHMNNPQKFTYLNLAYTYGKHWEGKPFEDKEKLATVKANLEKQLGGCNGRTKWQMVYDM